MWKRFLLPLVIALALLAQLPAASAAGPPTPATCDTPLILKLLPVNYAGSGVPADLPPYPVFVGLPLYPGARSVTPAPSAAVPVGALSPYQKAAGAQFTVSADPGSTSAWYAAAMHACGYLGAGISTTSTAIGAMPSYSSDYAVLAIPSLRITLNFESQPGGGALFTVWATVDALPPRPAASYISSKANEVEITYRTDGMNPPYKHVYRHTVVNSPLLIGKLIAAVNGPGTLIFSPRSCGGRDYHVTLTFHMPKGNARTARLECNEVTVGTFPPMWDGGDVALLAVQYVLAQVCHRGRCRT